MLSRQPLWNSLLTHFKEHVSRDYMVACSGLRTAQAAGCGTCVIVLWRRRPAVVAMCVFAFTCSDGRNLIAGWGS